MNNFRETERWLKRGLKRKVSITEGLLVAFMITGGLFGGISESAYAGTVLGGNATATGANAIAGGEGAKAEGSNSIAMGYNTKASGTDSIAMGYSAKALEENAIAMGNGVEALGQNSVAMGAGTKASGGFSLAMGYLSEANGDFSVALGESTKAEGSYSFAAGYLSEAKGRNSFAYGGYYDGSVSGYDVRALANTNASIAFGEGTVAGTDGGSEEAVAIGYRSKAIADKTMALGFDAEANVAGGFALGSNAKADTAKGKYGYDHSTGINSTDESAVWKSTMGALAIGDIENNHTRQITGLAAGTDDDDAVNVAQLKKVQATAAAAGDKKNYFHVNVTGTVQTGNNTNLDSVDGVGGAKGIGAIAIGQNAVTEGDYATVIGGNGSNTASGEYSTAMGSNTIASGQYSTVMGLDTIASGGFSTAMGEETVAFGKSSIATGFVSKAVGSGSIAMGGYESDGHQNKGSIAYAANSIAIGLGNVAGTGTINDNGTYVSSDDTYENLGNEEAVAIGYRSKAIADKTMALGFDAEANVAGGFALGSNAKANTALGKYGYDHSTGINSTDESAVWKSTMGALAIGDAENNYTRQITGLAAGTDDDDAVNVAQLKKAVAGAGGPVTKSYFHINNGNSSQETGDPLTNLGTVDSKGGAITRGSIAIGINAIAGEKREIGKDGFGNPKIANQNNAIAIGYGAKATGHGAVAIGSKVLDIMTSKGIISGQGAPKAIGTRAFAIGADTTASGVDSTAMGSGTKASGHISTAMGSNTKASGGSSTAMGSSTIASGDNSTAMGVYTRALGNSAIAVGQETVASGNNSVAMNFETKASGINSFASGFQSKALGKGATAMGGNNSEAVGKGSFAVGGFFDYYHDGSTNGEDNSHPNGAKAYTDGSIAIGSGTVAGTAKFNPDGTLKTKWGDYDVGTEEAVAMGYRAKATGDKSLALGFDSEATGEQTIAVGTGIKVLGNNSGGFGDPSIINADKSYSVGNDNQLGEVTLNTTTGEYEATSNKLEDTFVLGNEVKAEVGNSVYLGTNSNVTAGNAEGTNNKTLTVSEEEITLADSSTKTIKKYTKEDGETTTAGDTGIVESKTINNITYGNFAGAQAQGAVSVGAAAKERRIQNLAAGEISSTSTDAINGSQLYATNAVLGNVANTVKNNFGGTAALGQDGSIAFTNIGGTGKDTIDEAIRVARTEVQAGDNITLGSKTQGTDGHDIYTINAKDTKVIGAILENNNLKISQNNNEDDIMVDLSSLGSTGGAKKNYFHVNTTGAKQTGNSTNEDVVDGVGGAHGINSIAIGKNAVAEGKESIVIGGDGTNQATGGNTVVIGKGNIASAQNGIAIGRNTKATGSGATAMGQNTIASGILSTAMGDKTAASGGSSMAVGYMTKAEGYTAVATGRETVASGISSFTSGGKTKAIGNHSAAFGVRSEAIGDGSFAVGGFQKYAGEMIVVDKKGGTAYSDGSIAMGVETIAGAEKPGTDEAMKMAVEKYAEEQAITLTTQIDLNDSATMQAVMQELADKTGKNQGELQAILIPTATKILSGPEAVAIGYRSEAVGDKSLALGFDNEATGEQSIAIGTGNTITGAHSGAFGDPNTVSGDGSYAYGNNNEIKGDNSYILGNNNTIEQDNTFIVGDNATATQVNSVVLGNNSTDKEAVDVDSVTIENLTYSTFAGTPVGVVSVGKEGAERQIINVAAGEISSSSTNAINGTQLYATNTVLGNIAKAVKNNFGGTATLTATGDITFTDIGGTGATTIHDAIAALNNKKNYFHINSLETVATGNETNLDSIDGVGGAKGEYSIAVGKDAQALQNGSVAIGTGASTKDSEQSTYMRYVVDGSNNGEKFSSVAIGKDVEAKGPGAVVIGGNGTNQANGVYAFATGYGNQANGDSSVALGYKNIASGMDSVAIGYSNKALGTSSVSIGHETIASADGSTAMGSGTKASGGNSTAMGTQTKAMGFNTTAMGDSTTALGIDSTAMGAFTKASGAQSTAMGAFTKALGIQSTAIGESTIASGKGSFAGGTGKGLIYEIEMNLENKNINDYTEILSEEEKSKIENGTASAEEKEAMVTKIAKAKKSLGGQAEGRNSFAFGGSAVAEKDNTIAIGEESEAKTKGAIALGTQAIAGVEDGNEEAVAIGYRTKAIADKTMALGFDAVAEVTGGFALGSNAKANTAAGKYGYDHSTGTNSTDESAVWKSTMGALAIGDVENNHTRQITGLAAGTDDDDAVNVAQLKKVEKVANKKNYFHVNATGQQQAWVHKNEASVDGIGGAGGMESITGGVDATAREDYGLAIGSRATVSHEDRPEKKIFGVVVQTAKAGHGLGGVALGYRAWSHTMTAGRHEAVVAFNHKDDTNKMQGGIAIGNQTHARVGTVDIGNRDYRGNIGDIDFKGDVQNIIDAVGATTVGTNSLNSGNFSTVSGAYNAITNRPTKAGFNGVFSNMSRATQGFGSTITGSLNSIENNFADGSPLSGVTSSIVGVGNRINKSNGSLIIGTGNKITNSYATVNGNSLMSAKDTIKEMQDGVLEFAKKERLANVGIFGGSNTVDYAGLSNISGVGNKLKGLGTTNLDNVSLKNVVDAAPEGLSVLNNIVGYENVGTNVVSTNIQGVHNTVTNGFENIVMGSNLNVSGIAEDTANGVTENLAEGNVIIGFNEKDNGGSIKESAKDVFVLGNDVKANTDNSVYLGSNTTEANTNATVGNGEYTSTMEGYSDKFAGRVSDGIVSVGAEGKERRIQNVAAGLISETSTDAINGSQLKYVKDIAEDKSVETVVAGNGISVGHTEGDDKTYTVSIDIKDVVSTDKTVKVTGKDLEDGNVDLAVNIDDDTLVKDSSTGVIKVADDIVNAANKKNYFHVNATGQAQTGNSTNLDSVDGIGGAHGAASLTAGINARALVENGIALGKGAKTVPEWGEGSGGIAIGTEAESHLMTNGTHEGLIVFGRDRADLVGGIAIGQNTHARIGNVDIGNRDYKGEIGDIDFNSNYHYNPHNYTAGVGATTLGDNSVNAGNLSTVSGGFNAITRTINLGNRIFRVGRMMQGFGSNIHGTLNSIEGNEELTGNPATSVDEVEGLMYSGMLSNIVGTGNRINKSNGSLIMGTGNEITNSYLSPTGENEIAKMILDNKADLTSKGKSVKELAEAIRAYSKENNLGSVGIVGSSNTADYTLFTNISGVGNKVSGLGEVADLSKITKKSDIAKGYEKMSAFNMVDGFENTAKNITHTNIQGSHNTVTNALENIVIGNNHSVAGIAEDTANGVAENLAERNVIIGFNEKTNGGSVKESAKDIFILGNDVKANTDNSVYLGSNATEANPNATVGNGEYTSTMEGYSDKFAGRISDGIVSVGAEGKERRIQNVAAGLISETSTDAVNGSQLKYIKDIAEDKSVETVVAGNGISVGHTEGDDKTYTVSIDIKDVVSADKTVKITGKDLEAGNVDLSVNIDNDTLVKDSSTGVIKVSDDIVNATNKKNYFHVNATGQAQTGNSTNLDSVDGIGGAHGINSIAIGKNVVAEGNYATVIGSGAASGTGSIAIGGTASGYASVAIKGGIASGSESIAMGYKTISSGSNSLAMGRATTASGSISTAMGYRAQALNTGAFAMGAYNVSNGLVSTAMGVNTKAIGDNSTTLGVGSEAFGRSSLATGGYGDYYSSPSQELYNPVATEHEGGKAYTDGSMALGTGTIAGTGIYNDNGTPDDFSDDTYTAGTEEAVAMGYRAKAIADKTMALGFDAEANVAGGFALGSNAKADTALGKYGYDISTGINSTLDTPVWKSTMGALAIGDAAAGHTRQITGLAAGTDNDDAVNVAQLKKSKVEVKAGTNITSVGKTQDATDGHDIYTINAKDTKVTEATLAGDTLTIKQNNNEPDLTVDLSELTSDTVDIKDIVSADKTVKIIGKDLETGNVDLSVNIDNDTLVKDNSTGEISVNVDVLDKSVETVKAIAGQDYLTVNETTNPASTTDKEWTVALDKDKLAEAMVADPVLPATENKAKDILEKGLDLTYKANGTGDRKVSLADGLDFRNGTDTIATIGDNGQVIFDLSTEAKAKYAKDTKVTEATLAGDTLTIKQNNNEPDLTVNLSSLTPNIKDVVSADKTVKIIGKDLETGNVDLSVNIDNDTLTKDTATGVIKVNATALDKSVETVEGTNGIEVTHTDGDDKKYTVGLDTETKTKVDNAMQTIVTSVDGNDVKTLTKDNNRANFISGDNITLSNDGGSIRVATKKNVSFDNVVVGPVVINKDTGINAGSKQIKRVEAGTDLTDAVNVSQLNEVKAQAGDKSVETVEGANGIKVTHTAGDDKTYTVALADDVVEKINGKLIFQGDTGEDFERRLNETVRIEGGLDNKGLLTDANIGVVSDGENTLRVRLAKNIKLGMDGSVSLAGTIVDPKTNTTTSFNTRLDAEGLIVNSKGKTVKVTSDGIDAGDMVIKHVANGQKDYDAVNVSQLKKVEEKAGKKSVEVVKAQAGQDYLTVTEKTPTTATNKEYTVGLDTTKLITNIVNSNTTKTTLENGLDLAYKANGTGDRKVSLADGLDFRNGTDTIATIGDNGQVSFDIKAESKAKFEDQSVEKVDGADGIIVTSTQGKDKTYTVKLAKGTQGDIEKAIQSIITSIDGSEVKTLTKGNNKANFITGDNMLLTDESGSIKVATKKDVAFDNVAVGPVVINKDTGINAGDKVISNVSKGIKDTDAVNVAQLNEKIADIKSTTGESSVETVSGANGIEVTGGTTTKNKKFVVKLDAETKEKIDSIGTGEVKEGDTNTVTGDTVYKVLKGGLATAKVKNITSSDKSVILSNNTNLSEGEVDLKVNVDGTTIKLNSNGQLQAVASAPEVDGKTIVIDKDAKLSVKDGAITEVKLANDSVTSAKIIDGTVAEKDLTKEVQDKLNAKAKGSTEKVEAIKDSGILVEEVDGKNGAGKTFKVGLTRQAQQQLMKVNNFDNRITNNTRRINKLEKSSKRGIAGAVAHSGVKFQEIGLNQMVVGAAVGYYKGEGAVAVGVQAAPTENIRVHTTVAATPGDLNDTSVSVGASWKFNLK